MAKVTYMHFNLNSDDNVVEDFENAVPFIQKGYVHAYSSDALAGESLLLSQVPLSITDVEAIVEIYPQYDEPKQETYTLENGTEVTFE